MDSAKDQIFVSAYDDKPEAARYLAPVVTVLKNDGSKGSNLDLVALANVIVNTENRVKALIEMNTTLSSRVTYLEHQVKALKERDQKLIGLIKELLNPEEEDDYE